MAQGQRIVASGAQQDGEISGVVLWRVGGGLIENVLEDDVVGLALLGLSLALGAFLCVRRRTGSLALDRLLAGMGAYGVEAGIAIALG